MVFDSFDFIFIFFPIVFILYNCVRYKLKLQIISKYLLVFCSFIFFSYWNIYFLYLILLSILFNLLVVKLIITSNEKIKKTLLIFGVTSNILYLGVFKYIDFFIDINNFLFDFNFDTFNLLFPLAISFYTIQQIAFLFDIYEKRVGNTSVIDYCLFVSFFPQLIAGPIVHYHETIPQFNEKAKSNFDFNNINLGIIIFSIGLFKKVILANNLGLYVDAAYSQTESLNLIEAWAASFAFTFQLYFDFSGYTDMAIGIGYLFNIILPKNFDSPFKSTNLIIFWQKWHITLTRFINTYIYLAIIKKFKISNFQFLMICTIFTFTLIGFWHGPSIMFILFGLYHGIGIVINHYFRKTNLRLNKYLSIFITFNFVNISFILFRSKDVNQFLDFIFAMIGIREILLHPLLNFYENYFVFDKIIFSYDWFKIGNDIGGESKFLFLFIISSLLIFLFKNTAQLVNNFKYNIMNLIYYLAILIISIIFINSSQTFIYFNF